MDVGKQRSKVNLMLMGLTLRKYLYT